jgi:hypothetical protein
LNEPARPPNLNATLTAFISIAIPIFNEATGDRA